MKKKLKAWIFCRVAPHSPTSLLAFQKEQLEEIAEACNMGVVGTTKVISDGKWLKGFEIKSLLVQIRRKKFDILLNNSRRTPASCGTADGERSRRYTSR